MREWNGGLLGGGFEPKAKPVFHNGIPEKFEFQLLPEDWDHFRKLGRCSFSSGTLSHLTFFKYMAGVRLSFGSATVYNYFTRYIC